MSYIQELILNSSPSRISQDIFQIIEDIYKKQERFFTSKNPYTQFKKEMTKQLYLKEGYKSYFQFLHNYHIPLQETFSQLIGRFKNDYTKLLFNNFILVDVYVNQPEQNNIYVLTEEEKQRFMLQKWLSKKISYKTFVATYGHYGLDPFELRNPRFSELHIQELQKVAKLGKQLHFGQQKMELEVYLHKIQRADLSSLVGLRELAKSNSLRVLQNIRQVCLSLQKKLTNSIFEYSIDQIQNLEKRC